LVGRADFNGTDAITHTVTNITGLTPDPKVFWFKNVDGNERLLVAETSYGPGPTYAPNPSKFSVYDAGALTKVWPASGTSAWSDLINVYAIATATVGGVNYIYGIDYDLHKIFRVANASGDDYAYDNLAGYIYTDDAAQKFGAALAIVGNFVYALFIRGTDVFGGSYNPSAIVKLPLSLDPFDPDAARNNTGLAANAVDLKLSGSYFYVPCIGGGQQAAGYNPGSKLQRVALANLAVNDLLINAASGTYGTEDTTDFRDISIGQNGEAFILKGALNSSGTALSGFLFRTTVTALDSASGVLITALTPTPAQLAIGTVAAPVAGYLWALLYDDADGKTWMAEGNSLSVYKYSGGAINQVANLGMSSSDPADNSGLAPDGYNLNPVAFTIYGQTAQLKGAQNPSQASNSAQANAAKASAGGEDEE
jgi:hypothetical protein